MRANGCPKWWWDDSSTLRLSPLRSTLDSRCSLESTQYRRRLDRSAKIVEGGRGQNQKKKNDWESKKKGGERGHSSRKGWGWEAYTWNGPVAPPSIFSDLTEQTLGWENTHVIVILLVEILAGKKKLYVPFSKWLLLLLFFFFSFFKQGKSSTGVKLGLCCLCCGPQTLG